MSFIGINTVRNYRMNAFKPYLVQRKKKKKTKIKASIRGFLLPGHGASPRVADGGVGLQLCRLAANMSNKQSWAADQERSSSLRFWCEANNLTL